MIKEGSRRDGLGLLTAVEFHEDLGGGTGHAEVPLAIMDIMTAGQEIRSQRWIMEQGLKDDCLVACLAHIPHATSSTSGTGILIGVVLDVELGTRVINPFALAIYQMSVLVSERTPNQTDVAELTLGTQLREWAAEPF